MKSKATKTSLENKDDAPKLTGNELDRPDARYAIGGKIVLKASGKAAFATVLAKARRKQKVSMMLDADVIVYFKRKARGRGYQTLINQALRQAIERDDLEARLRRVVREALESYKV